MTLAKLGEFAGHVTIDDAAQTVTVTLKASKGTGQRGQYK